VGDIQAWFVQILRMQLRYYQAYYQALHEYFGGKQSGSLWYQKKEKSSEKSVWNWPASTILGKSAVSTASGSDKTNYLLDAINDLR
jgi:hypothetical protein